MTVRIDGTNSTANPAITGADTDTGLQLGTNEIQFVTGGTNRATVESDGNLTIEDGNLVLAENHGIHFHNYGEGATIDQNLLDDYEEGTWTPSFITANGGETVTYSEQAARYTKIGDICYIDVRLVLHGTTGPSGGSGGLHVSGLPFTSKSSSNPPHHGSAFSFGFVYNWNTTNTPIYALIANNDTKVYLYYNTNNNQCVLSDLKAGSYLMISGCYKTA